MCKKGIVFLLLFLSFKLIGQELPESGFYDNIILKVSSDNVEGYFYSITGNGQISCFYKFKGNISETKNNTINIIASYNDSDEKYIGQFIFIDKTSFKIKFEEPLPGDMACDNVSSAEGNIFKLLKKIEFTSIGVLKKDRNYFYKKTNNFIKSKSYLLNNEAVAVISSLDKWLFVCYLGTKITYGWMPKENFYSY